MKRVLVTGATGCVGRHALPHLLARGWDVHAVSGPKGPVEMPGVTWHAADLLDPAAAAPLAAATGASHLLHLAWYVAPGRWAQAPENVQWVRASLALFEAFAAAGGSRIVVSGSCLEYDWSYGYCREDHTPHAPHTVYGTCKHALRLATSAFAETRGLSWAWGRIFFLYGPHEHPDRLVASVIRSVLAGEPARCSHGNQIRDYLFADDVAEAFVALLESDVTGSVNVASGTPVALKDIVLRIGERLGRPELIRLGAIPAAPTDKPFVVADVTRVHDALPWRPDVGLDEGLDQTIAWWRTQLPKENALRCQ